MEAILKFLLAKRKFLDDKARPEAKQPRTNFFFLVFEFDISFYLSNFNSSSVNEILLGISNFLNSIFALSNNNFEKSYCSP